MLLGLLLLAPCVSAGMTSALLRAAGRANAIESMHFEEDLAAETLRMLDTNQDGNVDAREIEAFARNVGIDAASATEDFSDLDINGDGVLDPTELLQVSGEKPTNATTENTTKPTNVPKLAPAATQLAASVKPHTVKGAVAEKPTSINTGTHGARISIQDAKPVRHPRTAPPAVQPRAVPQEHRQAAAKVQVSRPMQVTEVPQPMQVTELAKPTPLDRMVKHFAQVLRNADVVPMHEDTIKFAKNYVASAAGYATNDFARETEMSAAKEVAEQLFISETAEAKAREYDRRASEQRANATVLAKLTTQQALNAAAAAAHSKANALLARIASLEDQAERAQVRSAALHSKAKLETEEASELMEVADQALNRQNATRSLRA